MKHKAVLILGVVTFISAAAVAAIVMTSRPAPPPTELVATPSATPSPTAAAEHHHQGPHDGHDEGVPEFAAANPILRHLPKETPYWTLQIAGEQREGKLPILATIRYEAGMDKSEVVQKQTVFIDQYLQSIGQPHGTYELKIETDEIDTYFSR